MLKKKAIILGIRSNMLDIAIALFVERRRFISCCHTLDIQILASVSESAGSIMIHIQGISRRFGNSQPENDSYKGRNCANPDDIPPDPVNNRCGRNMISYWI